MKRAGFTLIELLVVIAIIGVLATLAVGSMNPKPRVHDVAERLGELVREASRRAVALGPPRANVAVAMGSKARTRLTIDTTASDTTVRPTFIIQRLEENAVVTSSSATWIEIARYTVPSPVKVNAYAPGKVGSRATLAGLGVLSTSWTALDVRCMADGTCQTATIFLERQANVGGDDDYDPQARLSILPLGGATMTRKDWN